MAFRISIYLLTLLFFIGAMLYPTETAVAEKNRIIGTIDDYTEFYKLKKSDVIIHQVKSLLGNPENILENNEKTIMDEETKAKAKEILKNLREGKITIEEARHQFKELGIILPEQENSDNLDDVTKEKVGSIAEDARSKLKDLGLKLPKRFERFINDKQE